MQLINEGAAYVTNLGNAFFGANYITSIAQTNETKKIAIKKAHADLTRLNLHRKLSVFRLVNTGNAFFDRYNFLKPFNGAGNFMCSYVNDLAGAHTTAGFAPAQNASIGTARYGLSEFIITPTTDMSYFHMHMKTRVAMTLNAYAMGCWINTGGTNIFIQMARNAAGRTQGGVGINGNVVCQAPVGYDVAKTGVLGVVRTNASQVLYDDGIPIATGTTPAITLAVGAAVPFYEGTCGLYSNTWVLNSPYTIVAYGNPSTAMTPAEVSQLHSIINALDAVLST